MFVWKEGIFIIEEKYKYSRNRKKIYFYQKLVIVLIMSIFTYVSTILTVQSVNSRHVTDEICHFFKQQGYDIEDIGFNQVSQNHFFNVRIYHSSKPIRYNNQNIDYWKVQRIAKITRTYYVITPYYEEVSLP